jgi:hypothetical protein
LRADTYLLSRFGASQAEAIPVLDALSPHDVFTTLERIGAACEGYSPQWGSAEKLGVPLSVVQANGFEVLAEGKFDNLLTNLYDTFVAQGGSSEDGFRDSASASVVRTGRS